jgi:hypothetical protein
VDAAAVTGPMVPGWSQQNGVPALSSGRLTDDQAGAVPTRIGV